MAAGTRLRTNFLLALLAALACVAPWAHADTNPVPLDRVLVIVNDEAITQWDMNEQRRILLARLPRPLTEPAARLADALRTAIGEPGPSSRPR